MTQCSTRMRRKGLLVVGGIVALLVVAGCGSATILSGATDAPTSTTDSGPPPAQQGAPGANNPAGQKAEAAYLVDLQAAGVPITAQSTIEGHSACTLLAQKTSRADTEQQTASSFHLTANQADSLVDVAIKDFCEQG